MSVQMKVELAFPQQKGVIPEYEVYLHLKTELEEHRMWKPIWLITNNSNKN